MKLKAAVFKYLCVGTRERARGGRREGGRMSDRCVHQQQQRWDQLPLLLLLHHHLSLQCYTITMVMVTASMVALK